jgi:hypothetical protein
MNTLALPKAIASQYLENHLNLNAATQAAITQTLKNFLTYVNFIES